MQYRYLCHGRSCRSSHVISDLSLLRSNPSDDKTMLYHYSIGMSEMQSHCQSENIIASIVPMAATCIIILLKFTMPRNNHAPRRTIYYRQIDTASMSKISEWYGAYAEVTLKASSAPLSTPCWVLERHSRCLNIIKCNIFIVVSDQLS